MILSSIKVLRASVFVFLLFVFLSSCQQNAVQPTAPPSTASQDTVPPVITLSCGDTIYHTLGFAFTPPVATAYDSVDGDVSANIAINGPVNQNLAGTYWLYYTVAD